MAFLQGGISMTAVKNFTSYKMFPLRSCEAFIRVAGQQVAGIYEVLSSAGEAWGPKTNLSTYFDFLIFFPIIKS